jgi:hypothetical protein
MGSGEYDKVEAKADPQTGDTVLFDDGDPTWQSRLHFQRTSPTTLTADGTVNGNRVKISLTLENAGKTHLTDTPRWVSDGCRW